MHSQRAFKAHSLRAHNFWAARGCPQKSLHGPSRRRKVWIGLKNEYICALVHLHFRIDFMCFICLCKYRRSNERTDEALLILHSPVWRSYYPSAQFHVLKFCTLQLIISGEAMCPHVVDQSLRVALTSMMGQPLMTSFICNVPTCGIIQLIN